jgi:hypothetical protein
MLEVLDQTAHQAPTVPAVVVRRVPPERGEPP